MRIVKYDFEACLHELASQILLDDSLHVVYPDRTLQASNPKP